MALGGIYIGLVRVDQALTDANVNDGNTHYIASNATFQRLLLIAFQQI